MGDKAHQTLGSGCMQTATGMMGTQGTGRNSAQDRGQDGGPLPLIPRDQFATGSVRSPQHRALFCRAVFRRFGESDTKWPVLELHVQAAGFPGAAPSLERGLTLSISVFSAGKGR